MIPDQRSHRGKPLNIETGRLCNHENAGTMTGSRLPVPADSKDTCESDAYVD